MANLKMIEKKCKLPRPKVGRLEASETQLVYSILEYLKLRHFFAWRVNTGKATFLGGTKTRRVSFGFPGVSDIIGIVRHLNRGTICNVGQFLAIEVKRPGKKLTADQEAFKIAVEENGGLFILAHSVEDVRKALAI